MIMKIILDMLDDISLLLALGLSFLCFRLHGEVRGKK